jgi:GNAT superfamily N-acetyltransferase
MTKPPRVIDGSVSQAETAIRWRKNELRMGVLGGGFYHNRSIIRRAARTGELKCLVSDRRVLGFAVFARGHSKSTIDILEIREPHRRRGYGHLLAKSVIYTLHHQGAPSVEVECAPRESEFFWRSLGFFDKNITYDPLQNPQLILHL